ncbi:ORF6C domain-containing protein [Enterococcus gallinarum]|uniref:ORF6C domain-containing protein n=1 Tax=Enterococcus gallinarum TaxID=1353 RepID=UPI0018AAEC00|nr:ORF6C domain-containing protein [Enterococcus gallinarum]
MGNQLTKNNTIALIHTLETQGKQSEALVSLLREMGNVKEEMIELKDEVKEHVNESRSLYEKMSEQVTITYEEQKELRSIVSKLAISLTEEHQKRQGKTYSGNLFKAWKGMFMSRIHSKLKKRMNVVRYTSIKRVDYDEALAYLNVLTYDHFSLADLQATPAVLNVLELEEK